MENVIRPFSHHLRPSISLAVSAVALFALLVPQVTEAKQTAKVSISQFRIIESQQQSYWLQSVSGQYKNKHMKLRMSQPLIQSDEENGLGNALIKVSKLGKMGQTYVDVHIKRKMGNADKAVTLPTHDTGLSMELSRIYSGILAFTEVGYWWREATTYQRKDTPFYTLGIATSFSKTWLTGLFLDHKPTAYREMDRSLSLFLQSKVNSQHKVSTTLGKGLEKNSPDWLVGLQWSVKTTIGQ